ncbi:phytochelatin synthase [Sinobacterium caligoides]|uniref:glutathione gamma-glutamylcysteinyltransferase n=1 Tax=Sinobacterium caligoides TaxID=933926 RepID=A0A3N2DZ90_9GAMM|nr:phytochelatin synthase family protein [Sinobacterium caligoides]ROS04962.1 phytochelatin synthase [Sinobacterium caligoides]
MTMKKTLIACGFFIITLLLTAGGYVVWKLYPYENPQPLVKPLISVDSKEGEKRLSRATDSADYPALSATYQPQMLLSFCGVASSVAVLKALGTEVSQFSFFTTKTHDVRSIKQVAFAGMSLEGLAALLTAHDVEVVVKHADDIDEQEFRRVVERNLSTKGDYLLVNYQRQVLGQKRSGHISPLAAYDRRTDSVLIMDTAAHKYPATWVPLGLLFQSMRTVDASVGQMRGYVEVSL